MKKIKNFILALIGAGVLFTKKVLETFKKCSKAVRIIIIALLCLYAAHLVSKRVRRVIYRNFGRYEWRDERICGNIWIHEFHDDKIRLYDESTGKYTTPKLNWISDISDDDSIVVYALPEKRGYLNVHTGEIVIEAKEYQKAWIFSEGLAAVVKDGMIGFINRNNEVVIPFKFPLPKFDNENNYYVFHNGYCVMTDINGRVGLIDKKGEWVVEPAYEYILSPVNGYREVYDGLYGVLGPDLKPYKPAIYEYVNVDIDKTVTLAKDGRMWMEDLDGNVIVPFMYDYSDYLEYPEDIYCAEETCYVLSEFSEYYIGNKVGIMNRVTGMPITDAIYDEVKMISSCVFEVTLCNSFDRTVLDLEGNVIFP